MSQLTAEQHKVRLAIIRDGHAAGRTWAEIVEAVNAAEGASMSFHAVRMWSYRNVASTRRPLYGRRPAPSHRDIYVHAELAKGRSAQSVGDEIRATVIRDAIASGLSWEDVAERVSQEEGLRLTTEEVYAWAMDHVAGLPLSRDHARSMRGSRSGSQKAA